LSWISRRFGSSSHGHAFVSTCVIRIAMPRAACKRDCGARLRASPHPGISDIIMMTIVHLLGLGPGGGWLHRTTARVRGRAVGASALQANLSPSSPLRPALKGPSDDLSRKSIGRR
jgi:hypothetical protein